MSHEVWNVYHKMLNLGIYLCYNTYSHICVQHQHYPEHDTLCMSIFFQWLFFIFYLINDTIFSMLFRQMFLEFISQSYFFLGASVHLNLGINFFEPSSLTFCINWYIYIALINGIESINHFFVMPRCTYDSINYNWVTL